MGYATNPCNPRTPQTFPTIRREFHLTVVKEIAGRGDLDELVLYLKQNDLDFMYNHPFYHDKKQKLNWKRWEKLFPYLKRK